DDLHAATVQTFVISASPGSLELQDVAHARLRQPHGAGYRPVTDRCCAGCVAATRQLPHPRESAGPLAGLLVRRPILKPNGSLTCPNHWLPGTSDRSCSMVPPAVLARSRVPSRSATCTYSVTPRPDGCPASDAWRAPIWVSPTFTSTYPSKPCIDSNCHGKIAP